MSQKTGDDYFISLRNKTKGQVMRALQEYTEYELHVDRYLVNHSQHVIPWTIVTVPWIASVRLQTMHTHLRRANDVCDRPTITNALDYMCDLREAGDIAQSYQRILADVNYMARWVDKVNHKFQTLEQTLRHPDCRLTHPVKSPPGSPVKVNPALPKLDQGDYRPVDPQGIWDHNNASSHWPGPQKLEKLTSKIKECSLKEEPVEPNAWRPFIRRKPNQVPKTKKPLTNEGPITNETAQPQSSKPVTLLNKATTSKKSYAQVATKTKAK